MKLHTVFFADALSEICQIEVGIGVTSTSDQTSRALS